MGIEKRPIYNKYFAEFDEIGEEGFFSTYLSPEGGTLKKMFDALGLEYRLYFRPWYFWLKRDEGNPVESRWDRWQECKKLRAQQYIEEIDELTNKISLTNVQKRKTEISSKQWLVEKLDGTRDHKGNRLDVNINAQVTLKSEWAAAMQAVGEQMRQARMEQGRAQASITDAEFVALPAPTEDAEDAEIASSDATGASAD